MGALAALGADGGHQAIVTVVHEAHRLVVREDRLDADERARLPIRSVFREP